MIFHKSDNSILNKYLGSYVVNKINEGSKRFTIPGMNNKLLTISIYNMAMYKSILRDLPPDMFITILNLYLEAVISAVENNNGYIVSINGDEIICIHGLDNSNQVIDSCLSSFQAESLFESQLHEYNFVGLKLLTCGINTGNILFGSIGSDKRLFVNIMGDHVNLTSRIVKSNRLYNTNRIISDFSIRNETNSILYRELDKIKVSGVNDPIKIYELLDCNL